MQWHDVQNVISFGKAALDLAVAAGVTDLVVPNGWPIRQADRWDSHGWGATSGSGKCYRTDGATIRVWAWDSKRSSAEEVCTALTTFREATGHDAFISVPTLGHTIAMDYGKEDGKKKRAPRWQLPDEQADIWEEEIIDSIRAWGDPRAKEGVTSYDRNKSYLPALTQARLAPLFRGEAYEHYGADAPVDRQAAGLYKIVVPAWDSPLPPPHGAYQTGEILWVSADLMTLYADLGVDVEIIEAWLAPAHKIPHIEHLSSQVKGWLTEFDDPTRIVPKKVYQAFAGSIRSTLFRGRGYRIYRPDWASAIEQNAWCSVLRKVYAAYNEDQRFIPVGVNVDAVKYRDDLPTPPGFVIGDGLGQYKIEE